MIIQNLVYWTKPTYDYYPIVQQTVNFIDTDSDLEVVIGYQSGMLKLLVIPGIRSQKVNHHW